MTHTAWLLEEQVVVFHFYSYVWILANSWYQIFTMRRKKVDFLNFIFCYSYADSSYFCYNLYFRRIIKDMLLVHIKLLMQFRLYCCTGYVFEVNKARCISVSTSVYQHVQLYKHILLIMITIPQ